MADSVVCCSNLTSYKNRPPSRPEDRAANDLFSHFFMVYGIPSSHLNAANPNSSARHVFQVVQKIDFTTTVVSKKYYRFSETQKKYEDISEIEVLSNGFTKTNHFKNFKCPAHSTFIEFNLYVLGQAVSAHHVSTIEGKVMPRDSSGIDLNRGSDAGDRYWEN
jgi:hypothetical protein